MRAIPILLMAVLAAAPASAQEDIRWYVGPTLGWINTHEDPTLGLNAGVSFQGFEEHPNLRVDLRFIQRSDGGLIHSLQAPVLYTTMLTETGYAFAGPAIGYTYVGEHIVDLSAVGGFGVEFFRTEATVIGGEVAYNISLPLYFVSYYGLETHDALQALSLSFTHRW